MTPRRVMMGEQGVRRVPSPTSFGRVFPASARGGPLRRSRKYLRLVLPNPNTSLSFWFLGKDAILIGANLTGANLAYADLTSAHLAITDLSGAFLAGANLTGVVWSHTICPDGTNSDNNGFTCCGHLNGAVPLTGCNQRLLVLPNPSPFLFSRLLC